MHNSISAKRREIVALCREYRVHRLEVFGSAARGTDFDVSRSDADFIVAFASNSARLPLDEFFGLQAALARVIGRPVDLVEDGAVQNPYVMKAIERDRELLYAA
jgi:predicted nucleotidyltransferase